MNFVSGPFLIAIAALLWATDAVFRVPSVKRLDPALVVLIEHTIGMLIIGPYIFFRHRKDIFKLSGREWLGAFLIGSGASALATLFFTASFRYLNPSVAILLQKLQPIITVILAYLLLGEAPNRKFFLWALLALFSATLLAAPDLATRNFIHSFDGFNVEGLSYSIAAASLWACATVAAKVMLRQVPVTITLFWRYTFGWMTLLFVVFFSGLTVPLSSAFNPTTIRALFYMATVPGILALFTYYAGLKRTTASLATFIELLFPIAAILINTVVLDSPLSMVQVLAGFVLVSAVTRISLL